MHRIDADANVGNMFAEGDPDIPTVGTQVDDDWLNAVQEEIVNVILNAGITLVKGTNNQLGLAITSFFTALKAAANTWTALQTFTAGLASTGSAGVAGGAFTGGSGANGATGNATGNAAGLAGVASSTSGSRGVTGAAAASGTFAGSFNGGASGEGVRCQVGNNPVRAPLHIVVSNAAPSSPLIGDFYVDAGGVLYYYDGSWRVVTLT